MPLLLVAALAATGGGAAIAAQLHSGGSAPDAACRQLQLTAPSVSTTQTQTVTVLGNCNVDLQYRLNVLSSSRSPVPGAATAWEWNRGKAWTQTPSAFQPGQYLEVVEVRDGATHQVLDRLTVPFTILPAVQAPPPATSPADLSAIQNPAGNYTALYNAMSAACPGSNTPACEAASVAAVNAARAREGVGPLTLPADFWSLAYDQQEFILVNEERVGRGLAPFQYLSASLNGDALQGAQAQTDPTYSKYQYNWDSNWADGPDTVLQDFTMMYDDGYSTIPGSGNVDCDAANRSGCWGHRDNILADQGSLDGNGLYMGAACVTIRQPGYYPTLSCAELFYEVRSMPDVVWTWSDAVAAGA